MKVEPRTLPGFMELLPSEQIQFNSMVDKIRKSYERFGFLPIDTPIIEMADVLLAKAGGETEKQIYRFNKGENDLALRFDLTLPLAKYVCEYQNDITCLLYTSITYIISSRKSRFSKYVSNDI